MFLHHTAQWTRAIGRVIAAFSQPIACRWRQSNADPAIRQLRFQLQNKFIHHFTHHFRGKIGKRNNRIKTIAKFRGEGPFNGFSIRTSINPAPKANGLLAELRRPGIGGHDDHDIAEINRLAIVIGQTAIIHHLQQQIENIRMGFFNFIQQQNCVRRLIHRICQKTALVKANIARRRTDQARNRMAFHIFRHIKPNKFNAQTIGQLPCHFCFANTRRAAKQIIAHRLFRFTQPGA